MAGNYEIPWAPPDYSAALQNLGRSFEQRHANERANKYLTMEQEAMRANREEKRVSHEEKLSEEKRKHAIEAYHELPTLLRAAQKSVGEANANPYGIKFDETRDLPANVEGPQASPEAEAARFAPPVQAPEPTTEAGENIPAALHSAEEGPEQDPRAELARHTIEGPQPLAEPPASAFFSDSGGPALPPPPSAAADLLPPTPEAQHPLLAAAANSTGMAPGPEGKRRVFADYQGQRFEVPDQKETTGLGAEYDHMFQGLLDTGEFAHPQDAMKLVVAQYKSDKTQQHIADRTASTIEARQGLQQNQFNYGREQGLNREDKLSEAEKNRIAAMERARVAGNSRVAASAPALKTDTANRQDLGTLRQGFKDWKNTVNLAIDSKSHKRLATAMSNLDSGNAMQQREAAESLVSIFKGGGQVTKASQDLLLHNLAGLVGDAQTWLSKLESGHYGDRELQVLRQATQNALAEEQDKLKGYQESAAETFGPGSGYEQLGGNVNAMVGGAFKQFGYDIPPIYPNATESVVLGSGKRPHAPKPKSQIPAGATTGTMHGKRGYVVDGKFVPVE